jgi:hypothetical protein
MRFSLRQKLLTLTVVVMAVSFVNSSNVMASEIRSDEEVIFFPTLGRLSEDGSEWILPVHGWIFEPEEGDLLRAAVLDWAAEALELPRTPEYAIAIHENVLDWAAEAFELPPGSENDEIFRRRARWFLVDNERGKEITIEIAGYEHALPRSTPNGHFSGELRLPAQAAAQHSENGWLPFRAQVNEGDEREFAGRIHLLEREGTIVISDIDDTIKITEVTNHQRLLARTFLEPFEAVPGMADLYRSWEDEWAAIHLVSNGPWQLYPEINDLCENESFPQASWSMCRFRLKERTGIEFLFGGRNHKLDEISRCIESYPERDFILVGDTGERDPEIYGDIARQFPEQVKLVLLRNVTDETSDSPRLREALRDVPADRWRIFSDAAELSDISLAD